MISRGGDTLLSWATREALPENGAFFALAVYQRVGKSTVLVSKTLN